MYVLIVDDEADARMTLNDLLQLEGYATIAASNGREAMDVLATCPDPDLILLDLMMPGMDGWQFIEALRNAGGVPPPICVITALWDVAEQMGHPVVEVLGKPYEPEDLLRVVGRYSKPDLGKRGPASIGGPKPGDRPF